MKWNLINLLIIRHSLGFGDFVSIFYKNMLLKQLLGDKLIPQAYLKNVGKGLEKW